MLPNGFPLDTARRRHVSPPNWVSSTRGEVPVVEPAETRWELTLRLRSRSSWRKGSRYSSVPSAHLVLWWTASMKQVQW